ncbi:TrmH family RNA methyltransferase [Limosilactobacillus fastidiosus]|uniref:RNA methyltransferase n=1 Tax=Limosilactobacillus fastidiosus TaxID=2759855 RepID=A0A7W3YC28_9LACO|nr:RNA methyltransferase [Limosilactobacillus fastidiosus]MBB1063427.1 RNA methyltransferase [Limosilactobacillus fastidiosus]MBB1085893.1 RNA methyltransferase [Limosilactobacillus fastidiosus]MCD7084695.1 RNA methyltransferase [Limosilactobacillus fastidiosus]MCD7085770.1 RNA methyltransferase [Limosilactobacillus fastidiosus]MCD7113847.1 RNA methyltransferase [Limosilactobacillus fastidiosus]
MHNLIFLTDLVGNDLDPYVRLNEAQLFHARNLFIAESPKVIERALRAGYQPASLLVEEKFLDRDLADLDHEMAINQTTGLGQTPIYVANSELLRQLPGYNLLRGALSTMYRVERPDLTSFLAKMPADHPRIAVLESVVNPANIGAIFRSAAALGIDGVIVTSDSADPLYRRASRVAMGTVFQVPWTYVDAQAWQAKGISLLHQYGYQAAAMALRHNTVSIDDSQLDKVDKLAIILGSEGPGLREKTITESDFTIKIPMTTGVDSLNVAAASALAFWELGKRQTK